MRTSRGIVPVLAFISLLLAALLPVAGIAAAGSGTPELSTAERQWLKEHPAITQAPDPGFKMTTGTVSAVSGVLLLLVIYWNYSLRKTVNSRTASLQQELEERRKAEASLINLTEHLEDLIRERTGELQNEITERIKTGQQLKISEENYREISGLTSDFVHKCTRTGTNPFRIQWIGGGVAAISGYSAEEICTEGCWIPFVHPDDKAAVVSRLFSLTPGDRSSFEFRLITKGGDTRWIAERSICKAGDEAGELVLLGSSTDITERKQAEEAIAASNTLLQTIINTVPMRVFWKSTDLRYMGCNAAFAGDAGVTQPDDLIGRDDYQLAWQEQAECYRADDRAVIESGIPRLSYDEPQTTPDGDHIWLRTSKVPLRNEADEIIGVLGIYEDITSRKQAEEEHRNMEQQLLHTQKLESLGILAGGIAHDFNNILMAIIGNADLALMRINRESPAVENLHRIEKAAARAADLAKQMLAYSGRGKFVVERIDVNRILEEMLHMLEVSVSKKAVLRLNPHDALPPVEADATQMRQIIMNLVINASEAIGDKSGVIAITTGSMECDRNYLKDVWLDENLNAGLYVYLEVSDNGCGMDKETMAKLFDPFFTTKFTGRGLGMAAVLGIVRGHKGAIKVYSEPMKGSTFKILLPACGRSAGIDSSVAAQDNWQGGGTVLLVDDEETVRSVGTEMLTELGFTVITANDGREALEKHHATPVVDFVILDLTMPHVDGEQCFRALRQFRPDVRVIMSSGYNEQDVTEKFAGKGLAGFVQKPYKLSVLKEAIMKMRKQYG